MKKLLSLLSVVTISGAALPTTIIDTSHYQKDNIKNLSELNWKYLTIIRNKRNTNNKNQSVSVFKTNGADKPTEQQIKEKILEKNNFLDITKIKVENITENSAEISIIGFSGKKTINFTVDKSVPIDKVITNPNLGEMDFSRDGNSIEEQVKFRLKELKPQLDTTKINITNISTNSAKIISNDTSIYTGEIVVNYSKSIKTVFVNTELGLIRINGVNKPTEQDIKNRLKELNKDLEKNINDFEVKDITTTSAKITYKRKDILSGEVFVNFISNIDLNKIITQPSLGEFMTDNLSNPTEQQIKNKVKELNPQVYINKIKIENISNNKAKIVSSDSNFYRDTVTINYTISVESINW